jgi:phosphopantetheinyl transferase
VHDGFRHLRFGVNWLEPRTARHAKASQRAHVAQLKQKLGSGWRLASHSHSRGTVAAAVANAPITRLGFDVEYADPARPWREIAAVYLPVAADVDLGSSGFCRLWTFGEAYFKAFGEPPDGQLLLRVARIPDIAPDENDEPTAFAARRYFYSERLCDDFWLTLVWEEAI